MRCILLSVTLTILLCLKPGSLLADTHCTEIDGWQIVEGDWRSDAGKFSATGKYSLLLKNEAQPQDGQISTRLRYTSDQPQVAAGIVFRFNTDNRTGFISSVRDVEKGVDAKWGPWDRPVVQLIRVDADGWKILQESRSLRRSQP